MLKISTRKIINYRRKKLKKTTEDGKHSHAYGLVESYSENGYIAKINLHV
jgi:hypothetical protein